MMTHSRTRLGEEEDTPLRRSVPLDQPRRESEVSLETVRTTESLQLRIAELEAQVDDPLQSLHYHEYIYIYPFGGIIIFPSQFFGVVKTCQLSFFCECDIF